MSRFLFALSLSLVATSSPVTVRAIEFSGHHGGVITRCNDPEFYKESPPPDARVDQLGPIRFMASENTLPETLVVQIDLEPVTPEITRLGNGTFAVTVHPKTPHPKGKAWIKVTAYSEDGCQQLHNWNIFITDDPKP